MESILLIDIIHFDINLKYVNDIRKWIKLGSFDQITIKKLNSELYDVFSQQFFKISVYQSLKIGLRQEFREWDGWNNAKVKPAFFF